jgi:hypothetical protein
MLLLSGCGYTVASRHENFIDLLNSNIGKNINEIPSVHFPQGKNMIDSKVLPNGNIENKYNYKGTCRYYYVIDPKTHKIISARFEGKDEDCSANY